MKIVLLFLSILPVLPTAAGGSAWAESSSRQPMEGDLVVVVTGLRNDRGLVNVAVFDRAEAFPDQDEEAVHRASIALPERPTSTGTLEVRFSGITPGDYAVIVLHDENGNLRMDRNIFGIPREGYGVSNDARNRLGPPEFDRARVALGTGPQRIEVRVRY